MNLLKPETIAAIKTLMRADGCPPEETESFFRAVRNPARPRKMGTARQAAEIIQCHPRTVQRYARRGLIHAIKYSCRRVRFDLNEVERFAQEGGIL